jgi:putative oxidoreductase
MAELQPVGLTGYRRLLLEWSDIPLRAALAATFIVHGYQKIFIDGLDKFAPMLAHLGVPAPSIMAWVVALTEFCGGIAIALGLCTRLAALGHAATMVVAISTVHFTQGFMSHAGMGFEWQFALLCIALSLAIRGAGPLSVDHLIRTYCCRKPAAGSSPGGAPAAS